VRFLALGDSYTIGEGVAETERWPSHLVRRLDDRGIRLTDVQLVAQTAWTADELADAIDEARPRGPFDLVTLMVGVNDQYRSRPVSAFAPEYQRLIARSIAFAHGEARRVIAISIPDWGATPFASGRDRDLIAREIEAYNERSRKLALRARVAWVDVTPASRATLFEPSLVTADGLHPSGQMYARWADLIAPAAVAALAGGSV
jgi:lysophospholipase L1-like esterase